jgi:hypothetical protein
LHHDFHAFFEPGFQLSNSSEVHNAEGPEFPGPSVKIVISTAVPAAPMGRLEPPVLPAAYRLAAD